MRPFSLPGYYSRRGPPCSCRGRAWRVSPWPQWHHTGRPGPHGTLLHPSRWSYHRVQIGPAHGTWLSRGGSVMEGSMCQQGLLIKQVSMADCKRDSTPVYMQWNYTSFASRVTHWYRGLKRIIVSKNRQNFHTILASCINEKILNTWTWWKTAYCIYVLHI